MNPHALSVSQIGHHTTPNGPSLLKESYTIWSDDKTMWRCVPTKDVHEQTTRHFFATTYPLICSWKPSSIRG